MDDIKVTNSPPPPKCRRPMTDGEPLSDIARTLAGELVIWQPSIRSEIRPLVTIGRFKDGTPCVNFRRYRIRPTGIASMLGDGCTVTPTEWVELRDRLDAAFAAILGLLPPTATEGT